MIRKLAGMISIAICAGYLLVGLWPFNFHPRNNVEWLPHSNGIHFKPLSVAYSSTALDLAGSAGEITIELWLEPEEEPSDRIASILSLYNGNLPENILIGQWQSEVLLRTPVWNSKGARKYREVGARAGLRKGSRRFVVLTSGPGGTAFYVDGSAAAIFPRLMLRPETLRGRLVLGSAPQGGSQWVGILNGAIIFNRALLPREIVRHDALCRANHLHDLQTEPQLAALYYFDEGSGGVVEDHSRSNYPLSIPETYRVIKRTLFVSPWKEPPHVEDVVANILGFVPLGFFFFIYRMDARPIRVFRNAFLTILVATIISVAIELIQAYLPTRDSSIADVICNSCGSVFGTLLAGTTRVHGIKGRL